MSSDPADEATRPLAGMRVLEVAEGISGPYAGKWLAALGADVIKVEPPIGDASRAFGPWPDDDPDDETSGLYLYLNTGKRGVTLNLNTSDGRELLKELAARVDVVIESYPPGYLAERGVGYDALAAQRPGLVMVSITPFGQTGPYAHVPATELTLFALSGQMWLTGHPGREPLKNGGAQPSYQTGLHALAATVSAYYGALVQGRGTHVDVAAQEIGASILEHYVANVSQGGEQVGRLGNTTTPVWGLYPCADGYAGICVLPRNWDRMAQTIGLPALLEPRFRDPEQRVANAGELEGMMYVWFADKTRRQLFDLGVANGVPFAYVASIEDLLHSEQLRQREYFALDEHPRAGRLTYPGRLWTGSGHDWRQGRAPELGEHNVALLHEELGYDLEDLVRLRELNAI